MSTDQLGFPSDGMQPVPKRKMSKTAKILIILGLVFGGFMVVCCGGVIWVGYRVANSVSEDPATVATVTDAITEIDVPEGLQPAVSVDMNFPLVGRLMAVAAYEDSSTGSGLIMFEMKGQYGAHDEEEMRRALSQQLRQQDMGGEQEEVLIKESEEREFEIRGRTATFRINRGDGANSGKSRIMVTGAFPGKTGTAILIINVDAEAFPEETIVGTLESIK